MLWKETYQAYCIFINKDISIEDLIYIAVKLKPIIIHVGEVEIKTELSSIDIKKVKVKKLIVQRNDCIETIFSIFRPTDTLKLGDCKPLTEREVELVISSQVKMVFTCLRDIQSQLSNWYAFD
jgi:hypothetical protein